MPLGRKRQGAVVVCGVDNWEYKARKGARGGLPKHWRFCILWCLGSLLEHTGKEPVTFFVHHVWSWLYEH